MCVCLCIVDFCLLVCACWLWPSFSFNDERQTNGQWTSHFCTRLYNVCTHTCASALLHSPAYKEPSPLAPTKNEKVKQMKYTNTITNVQHIQFYYYLEQMLSRERGNEEKGWKVRYKDKLGATQQPLLGLLSMDGERTNEHALNENWK